MSQCSTDDLLRDGKCFACLSPMQLGSVQAQLLCEILSVVETIDGNLPDQSGVLNYKSDTLTAVGNVTGIGRCIGIRVFGVTDGTFNINGGDTITVREGSGVDVNPGGNVSAPVVNWESGTLDVLIVGLT